MNERSPVRPHPAFTLSEEEELHLHDPEQAALSPGSNSSHRPQVGCVGGGGGWAARRALLVLRSLRLLKWLSPVLARRPSSTWTWGTAARTTRCWTGNSMQVLHMWARDGYALRHPSSQPLACCRDEPRALLRPGLLAFAVCALPAAAAVVVSSGTCRSLLVSRAALHAGLERHREWMLLCRQESHD
jgi:hypothetical protein